VILILKTLNSFETVLHQEIPEKLKLYASSLSICTTLVSLFRGPATMLTSSQFSSGLLLAFENGSKLSATDGETRSCRILSSASLEALIEVIIKIVEPFSEGKDVVDTRILPPFIVYSVYKAAAIVTERLMMGDDSRQSLQRLKSLRAVLKACESKMVCRRYVN
jgi:hypothetical protein